MSMTQNQGKYGEMLECSGLKSRINVLPASFDSMFGPNDHIQVRYTTMPECSSSESAQLLKTGQLYF